MNKHIFEKSLKSKEKIGIVIQKGESDKMMFGEIASKDSVLGALVKELVKLLRRCAR